MSLARPIPPSLIELIAEDWVGSEKMETVLMLLMAIGNSLDYSVELATQAPVRSSSVFERLA
jgi:hypothetical protein